MRGLPKERKSTDRTHETVSNLKRNKPSYHRTIRDRHPTWSAPNLRQQSITQMDALRSYYHPELENEDLKTDNDEADSYVPSPTRNKRRKISPQKQPACRIETRSAKLQATRDEPSIQEQQYRDALPSPGEKEKAHALKIKIPIAMLPPKTPMSLRRKEIPSSQSPADTPFSSQSRQSLQDYTRSPLKEKSTNIDMSMNSPSKVTRWSRRLEVADSMETGDEYSPVSVRLGLTTGPVSQSADPEEATEEEPQLPFHAFAIHVDDFNQRLRAAQRPVREIQNSSQSRPGHKAIDSTDKEDDNQEAEAFNVGLETQAALASTDVSQKNSDQLPESTPPTSKPAEDDPELDPKQRVASESPDPLDPLNPPSPPVRKSDVEDQFPIQRPKRVEFVDLANSTPPLPTTSSQLSERPSDSEEVSAQLFAELRRDAQPGGLQTESQFETGWTLYTPADDLHSGLDPLPSPPDHPSGLMTVPTQLIRPPISSPPKFYKAPVPPSQATTVDLTQPSPRNMPSSPQPVTTRPPQREPPSSSQRYPSSPPPVPPPSSPPSAGRKPDPWAGYVWDGVRLTESQLLPDSLWNDSEVGPPGLSQESWSEEA